MNPEDLQQQLDDITQRLDDSDTSLQDFSDSLDSSFSELSTSIEEQNAAIEEMQPNVGQLSYPLSQDTIDLICEQGPAILSYLVSSGYAGKVKMTGGSATVTAGTISASSIVLVSRAEPVGTLGNLSYTVSANTLNISSTNVNDESYVVYLILT